MRPVEGDRIDGDPAGIRVPSTELHQAERRELLARAVRSEVTERVDEDSDRPGARLRPEKRDDAFDLVDLAPVSAQARAVEIGDARFQLRPVELPPLHQFT